MAAKKAKKSAKRAVKTSAKSVRRTKPSDSSLHAEAPASHARMLERIEVSLALFNELKTWATEGNSLREFGMTATGPGSSSPTFVKLHWLVELVERDESTAETNLVAANKLLERFGFTLDADEFSSLRSLMKNGAVKHLAPYWPWPEPKTAARAAPLFVW